MFVLPLNSVPDSAVRHWHCESLRGCTEVDSSTEIDDAPCGRRRTASVADSMGSRCAGDREFGSAHAADLSADAPWAWRDIGNCPKVGMSHFVDMASVPPTCTRPGCPLRPSAACGGTTPRRPAVSSSHASRSRCRPVGRVPTCWHRVLGTPVLVAGHRCPYLVASQAIPAHRQAPHARARRLLCLWTDQEGRSCLRAPSPSPHAAAVAAGFLRTRVHDDDMSGDGGADTATRS